MELTHGSAPDQSKESAIRHAADRVFPGAGEMARRCRAFDWAATPLGPVEAWPQSLRTAAALALGSAFPSILAWGPERVQLYNDAYVPLIGRKHPAALGAPTHECWPEIRHVQEPIFERVFRGESVHLADAPYRLDRAGDGALEEAFFTASFVPVPLEGGGVGGSLSTLVETTAQVQARGHESERARLAERLRAVYDGTYEYIGLIAPDGTVLDCNRASLEFAGNTRESVLGQPFWDTPWFRYTPGAAELLRRSVARAAAGEFVRYEATLHRPTGDPITFDFSLHPIRDARGDVVFIVPEGRDVTERVRAEAALRASEARYRTLFESLDEGFCVIEMLFDAEGRSVDYRFVEANPAFVEQTGLVGAIGRTARELVPGLEEHWFERYGEVARTGGAIRFESGSDVMHRWFDVYAFRVGPAEERKVALLFKDVSAAKAAERERDRLVHALEVERARLAYVFRQAPTFLAVLRGPDHVFELVNDAYHQLVGYRDLVGRPVRDALPEVRGQGFEALLDGVLEDGAPFVGREVSVRLARMPGAPPEERFVDFVYLPLVEADGTRSGVIAHGTDVTEQVLARREVERLLGESERARAEAEAARAEAEAANRAKSDFLAVMSHELRTPLNAIGGYAELMEMGIRGPVSPQQREDLRRIQTSQRHLLGLINEVLNYAKLETGTVQYDLADLRVHESLVAAEALVAPQARAKGLALRQRPCDPELVVRADPEKLRQVLVNLLSNAVKFTDAGGKIEVSCGADNARALVRVRDTGIGIPPDKLEAIFDPFVQVRADLTRSQEGTGLGLAISRDLARGMGGDLTVASTLGEGSTFTLALVRA